MSRAAPSRERILEFARRFARQLHGIEPPEIELAERVDYVIWGRKQAWQHLQDGLITKLELRQLLIDHLDYECAHVSGRAWPEYDDDARARVSAELDEVLFGEDPAGQDPAGQDPAGQEPAGQDPIE